MNDTTSSRVHAKRGAILLLSLLAASAASTAVSWGVASSHSARYSSGFSIDIRTMHTRDGYHYQMYEIVPDVVVNATPGSIPCILFIHGLGGSKEIVLPHALSIAMNGYVVLVPDTRGQNSHTGPFSFGVDDVVDLQDLITWVQTTVHLPVVNKTAIGVFGHSMGALLALLLGARDDRILATVEASGPSNMSRVLEGEWFRISLIGSPVNVNDEEELRKRTPLVTCNVSSPRNLMIVHGLQDTSVPFDHAVDLNATVNPHGNRTDFQFIIYDSNHNLDHPAPGNASRTCYQDATARAVLWYDEHLRKDTSRPLPAVGVFQRDDIAAEMKDAYTIVNVALLCTTVAGFFVASAGFQLAWRAGKTRLATRRGGPRDPSIPVVPRDPATPGFRLRRELAYTGLYLASFAIVGAISLSWNLSLVLKTIIFPVLPLLPVVAIKARGERGAPWQASLGLTPDKAIPAVGAGLLVFGMHVLVYNTVSARMFARVTLIPYVFQAQTSIALPLLFWYIVPGIVALLLVDTIYFQELHVVLTGRVTRRKPVHFLDHWLAKAVLLALITGGIHTIGTLLFNIGLPDYDLRTIGSLPFMFKELLAILSMGIITGFVFLALAGTKLTGSLPSTTVVLALVLALVYITVAPRLF